MIPKTAKPQEFPNSTIRDKKYKIRKGELETPVMPLSESPQEETTPLIPLSPAPKREEQGSVILPGGKNQKRLSNSV